MQKFFTDTIESTFIKELVYSANIPSYDSISDGDYAFKDVLYIYKNSIVKTTKSGNIGYDAEYEKIRPYTFNEKINKVTENYISKFNYYDTDTHYQLGRYLRLYRDCTGIDLMPFYNCYSGKLVSDVYLGDKDEVRFVGDSKLTSYTSEYKIVLVPIRFNRKYTICIDSFSKVRIKPIFYGNFGIVVNNPFPETANKYFGDTEISYQYMSFKKPKLYELDMNKITYTDDGGSDNKLTDDYKTKMMSYEKYLYLLIQLPISNQSSILVQEGDYTRLTKPVNDSSVGMSRVYDAGSVDLLTNNKLNNILLSELQLQRMNTGESYAYSTRLIEYLLDNVITSEDQFGGDIERVQEVVGKCDPQIGTGSKGVWSKKIRSYLFNKYISTANNNKRDRTVSDINGFVDKDIEDYLNLIGNN